MFIGGSSRLDVPQPPSACPPAPTVTANMTKAEKFQIFRQKMQVRRRRAEMYSLWCDALYRLSLANHVSKLIITTIYVKVRLMFSYLTLFLS